MPVARHHAVNTWRGQARTLRSALLRTPITRSATLASTFIIMFLVAAENKVRSETATACPR